MQEPDVAAARYRLNTDRGETLRRIADLDREFSAIVASARDGSAGGDDEHDPEGATVAFERQHVAALLEQARGHLTDIDTALGKIASGGYGICEKCGGEIGAERLAARPVSARCIRCARTRG